MVRTFYNVYAICGFAAIGGGLFGFDISSMSGVLGTNAYKNYFNNPVSFRQGAITCSMPAGSFVGALASSFLADRYSRRTAIQIASLIWIVGSILQTCANGVALLCVGRVVAGICVGIASSIVPVYQAEIAPREIRGRVVSLQQWAITWGILIQYFVQYGASFIGGGPNNPTQPTAAFRIPWAIQILPGLILFIGLFFLPRSPRWLGAHDRWEEAIEVLAHLHGHGDVNHPKVLAEYQEIEAALRAERARALPSASILLSSRMARRVMLGMSIQVWSQLCGINVLMYFAVYVMEAAGVGTPLLAASIQYIINVALTLPAIVYLDRFGRRNALLAGSFLMMVFFFVTGALQGVYGQPNPGTNEELSALTWVMVDKRASKAVIACSYLFVATFATTWGPVSWIYPSEIFPSQIRALAVSLATASNWAINCILAFAVPPLLWSINWKTYLIFGCFNGLALIHVFVAAPETMGKTLEEMDGVFEGGGWAWEGGKRGQRGKRGSGLDGVEREMRGKARKEGWEGKGEVVWVGAV